MQNRLLTLSLIFLLGGGILFAQTKGRASYYSDKLHGNFMSNGERYHRDSMTCAHLKYPLGTLLKVRNLTNGKEVIVRVTDRGPHTRRFVIDLSKAAAKKLNIIGSGHNMVEITPYQERKVPFRWKDDTGDREMDISYIPALGFPTPYWQTDSAFLAKKNQPHKIKHLQKKVNKILREDLKKNIKK